jgi:hypothetical protein
MLAPQFTELRMAYYLFKILLTAGLVVAISEVAKRSTLVAALLASLPLISILALVWLYLDTQSVEKVAAFSTSVAWLVLPSLALFVSLPLFLKWGLPFLISLPLAIALTTGCYFITIAILGRLGVRL